MKMILFMLILPAIATAQCPEDPALHIGGYVRNPPSMYAVGDFGKKNLTQVGSRLDGIAALLQEALPQPRGYTLSWTPMPYEKYRLTPTQHCYYSSWFVQPYFCDKSAHRLVVDETPLSPLFVINGIDDRIFHRIKEDRLYGMEDKPKPALINGHPLLELPPVSSEKIPGGTLYQVNKGCNMSGNQHSMTDLCGFDLVVITKPGKELFLPITRRQYLDYLIKLTEEDLKKAPSDMGNGKLKQLYAFRDQMGIRDQQTAAYVPDQCREGTFHFNSNEVIRRLVDGRPVFTGPEQGCELVTFNDEYFDGTLPPYVPQLIAFSWQIDANRPFMNDFTGAVINKLNYTSLRGLLGK